ncbi:MAG: hypothetical protein Q8O57_05225, partial [Kiritimatiellota bacterium]|nr:hypothetical protein [Kiritimatiellota bacterium]
MKNTINPFGYQHYKPHFHRKHLFCRLSHINPAFVCKKGVARFYRICFVAKGLQYTYTAAPFAPHICGKPWPAAGQACAMQN